MAKPGLMERLKERKKLVEDDSTLEEGEGLVKAKEKEQSYEDYPSDKEAERPVRKSEGGRYEGMQMPDDYMKMPKDYMMDEHDKKRMKKNK